MTEEQIARVHKTLSRQVIICRQCGAKLDSFDEKCTASLDEFCPGFVLIERAAGDPSGQFGGPLLPAIERWLAKDDPR